MPTIEAAWVSRAVAVVPSCSVSPRWLRTELRGKWLIEPLNTLPHRWGSLIETCVQASIEREAHHLGQCRPRSKVAKAKGRLRGKAPKVSAAQETHLVGLYRAGKHHRRAGRTLHRRKVNRLPSSPTCRRT